jgi:formamidopyrimidine-DNA glycosylase
VPELPEVETTRRGIAPHLLGSRLLGAVVRERRLRWPVPRALGARIGGATIRDVGRRAKYLLLATERGTLIIHLGMSGSLRVVAADLAPGKHDHLDLLLDDGRALRLRDPRRFGCVLWTAGAPLAHPLLSRLGPEPWDPGFDGAYLHRRSAGRRQAVKNFLMDARTVVGVGNIYASEALFAAGIHPARAAGQISRGRYEALARSVLRVLEEAIDLGGTTLRDFVSADGEPGYFGNSLSVYGHAGEPCRRCGGEIRRIVIGQRASYYCRRCQR